MFFFDSHGAPYQSAGTDTIGAVPFGPTGVAVEVTPIALVAPDGAEWTGEPGHTWWTVATAADALVRGDDSPDTLAEGWWFREVADGGAT